MTAKKTILAAIMIASLIAALALFGCSSGSTKELSNDNVTKAVNTYIGKMDLEKASRPSAPLVSRPPTGHSPTPTSPSPAVASRQP